MTITSLLAGLFGAGAMAGLALLAAGLRGYTLGVGSSPVWSGALGRIDPRRLSGQGRRIAVCAAVAAAVTLWTGWPTMLPIAFVAGWCLPRVLGPDRQSKAVIETSEAIATFAEMLRDTLSAAAGLQQTLLAVCPLAPAPIAEACRQLADDIQSGTPLPKAIAAWADELADQDADTVAASLIIATKQQSGNTAAMLSSIAETARDYAAIRRRAMAAQAKTRTSGRIVISTVLTLIAGLVAADREFMRAYDSATGQLVLVIVAVLFGVALRWMDRLMHPEPAPRILTGLGELASRQQEVRTW
jgi:tight adherence protein B